MRGLRNQLGLRRRRTLLGEARSISDIVARQAASRTPLVVVVDDADRLSAASIEWLARLAARVSRADDACYIVLAGTPALERPAALTRRLPAPWG